MRNYGWKIMENYYSRVKGEAESRLEGLTRQDGYRVV